jgi:hypothetical protein
MRCKPRSAGAATAANPLVMLIRENTVLPVFLISPMASCSGKGGGGAHEGPRRVCTFRAQTS